VKPEAPFMPDDLADLEALLETAVSVVTMRDVYHGDRRPGAIGLRHDVDDNRGSLDTALALARWEHDRGYRATYFLLHDSHYWPDVRDAARELVQLNHEVGIHVNAIAEAIRQRRTDPHVILFDALHELRCAAAVMGAVAHGDNLCHQYGFVNDEIFLECARPSYGPARRQVAGVQIDPRSMLDYGLKYDANWLTRSEYLSDSGGRWSRPFEDVADGFPFAGQLHILVHPDWWAQAFVAEQVAV
jgi:hypothetical protein